RYEAVANSLLGEQEHVLRQVRLLRIENAGFLGVLDQQQELIDGVDEALAAWGLVARQANNGVAGGVHEEDERPGQFGKNVKRTGQPQGQAIRRLQRQGLGNQLAEDHMHESDQEKSHREGHGMSGDNIQWSWQTGE